jgi:hypothetical protein
MLRCFSAEPKPLATGDSSTWLLAGRRIVEHALAGAGLTHGRSSASHRASRSRGTESRKRPIFAVRQVILLAHHDLVSDTEAGGAETYFGKRLRRTPEEKRRIVEATFVPGASIARVARKHG